MKALQKIIERKSDDLAELDLFAGVCSRAMSNARKAVENIELQEEISKTLNEPSQYSSESELARAKARASEVAMFAKSQHGNGFSYLFSLCSVRVWALIEALVDELVIECLHKPAECPDQKILAKLKGPLIEFRAALPDEQAEFLAETLKQAVDAPLKLGVGRFEALLAPVGIGGNVQDRVQKTLYELSQIRNVIVHKGGKADRRIVEACPWLKIERGEPVHVTDKMFKSYISSAYWYLLEVRGRLDERIGEPRSERLMTALEKIEKELEIANEEVEVGSQQWS
jgi:hypothetical protein